MNTNLYGLVLTILIQGKLFHKCISSTAVPIFNIKKKCRTFFALKKSKVYLAPASAEKREGIKNAENKGSLYYIYAFKRLSFYINPFFREGKRVRRHTVRV